VPGQAERSWALRHSMAQLAASPSVQGPALYVPETHEGTLTQQGPSARARGVPWALLSDTRSIRRLSPRDTAGVFRGHS